MRSERECSNEKARRPFEFRQPPGEAMVSSAIVDPATSCSAGVPAAGWREAACPANPKRKTTNANEERATRNANEERATRNANRVARSRSSSRFRSGFWFGFGLSYGHRA